MSRAMWPPLLRGFLPPAHARSRWVVAVLFGCLLLALGCGKNPSEGQAVVTGKVTVDGKAPAPGGTIIFVGADKKEMSSTISDDGSYNIVDAPLGEVKVLVKGATKGLMTPGGAASSGAPIPPKYEKPNELTYTVVKGKQTKTFDLKP